MVVIFNEAVFIGQRKKGEIVLGKIKEIISTIRSPEVMPDVKFAAVNTVGGGFMSWLTWDLMVTIATFIYFVVQIVYIVIKCHKAIKGKDDEQ